MKREKMAIIPVFLPWMGCVNRCIYCNEQAITGYDYLNYKDQTILTQLDRFVSFQLNAIKPNKKIQIAFFGGSFSNAPHEMQERFLRWAHTYIEKGLIDSIRISTRPDSIDEQEIRLLQQYHCESIELGVQSFNDDVLKKNNRGHNAMTAVTAIQNLAVAGFEIGIHLMTGLYGSNNTIDEQSVRKAFAMLPDSIRIHPTLVLKDTPLEKLYLKGLYVPLKLREAVEELGKTIRKARNTTVTLNRIGLFIPNELRSSVVAGPYHPALGDMARIMANVLEVKDQLSISDGVSVPKKTYEGFKSHRGFFDPYVKEAMLSGRIRYSEVNE